MPNENKITMIGDATPPIQVAAELGRRLAVAQQAPQKASGVLDAAPYLVLRDANGDENIEYLNGRLEDPWRKTGTVRLLDTDSFIAYYNIHSNKAPVYATLRPAQFIAVLNDHTEEAAGWRDHRANFLLGFSAEWNVWAKHNGMGAAFGSNDAFAMFLEENAPDIIKPESALMLSIALNFRVNESVAFANIVRLQDGNTELVYNALVDASSKNANGGKIKIPEQFTIEVPVFDGPKALKYKVDARFRFRLRDGKLAIWYELIRPHKVVEQAFQDIWTQIEAETEASILLGTPE